MASVDTVMFKLLNTQRYPQLKGILFRKKAYGFTRETAFVPDANAPMIPIEIIRATKFDGRQSRKAKINYIAYLPSHSAKITCLLDLEQNFAMFQVSLPKFRYGHNVRMLYDNMPTARPEDSLQNGFDSFKNAMNDLLRHLLELQVIPWYDIIIERIDMCMNYLAPSQEAAMQTINNFSGNKKLYQRVGVPFKNTYESTNFADMASTVFLNSQSHSFKIYHKGEEFFKHDYKIIAKYNLELANQLLDIARRTVRYEATFRKRYINYLYLKNTAPSFVQFFFDNKPETDFVRIIRDHLWDVLPSGLSVYNTILSTGLKIDSLNEQRSFAKISEGIHKLLGRTFDLNMAEFTNYNSFHIIEHKALFDIFIYSILGNRFQKFVDEISIDTDKLPEDAPQKIKKYKFMCSRVSD